MDVAKRLVDWTEQPPEQWLNVVNKYLPPAVTAVLVVLIAYQLANITWSVVPGAPPTLAARPVASKSAQPPADLGKLTDSHLFGEARAETAPVVETVDAPDTTLEPFADRHPLLRPEGPGHHLGQSRPGKDLSRRRRRR